MSSSAGSTKRRCLLSRFVDDEILYFLVRFEDGIYEVVQLDDMLTIDGNPMLSGDEIEDGITVHALYGKDHYTAEVCERSDNGPALRTKKATLNKKGKKKRKNLKKSSNKPDSAADEATMRSKKERIREMGLQVTHTGAVISPALSSGPSESPAMSPTLSLSTSPALSPSPVLSPSPALSMSPSPALSLSPSPALSLSPSPALLLTPSPVPSQSPAPSHSSSTLTGPTSPGSSLEPLIPVVLNSKGYPTVAQKVPRRRLVGTDVQSEEQIHSGCNATIEGLNREIARLTGENDILRRKLGYLSNETRNNQLTFGGFLLQNGLRGAIGTKSTSRHERPRAGRMEKAEAERNNMVCLYQDLYIHQDDYFRLIKSTDGPVLIRQLLNLLYPKEVQQFMRLGDMDDVILEGMLAWVADHQTTGQTASKLKQVVHRKLAAFRSKSAVSPAMKTNTL